MIENIQNLVENENAIAFITAAFFFYAIILWLLVPIWVYIDSKKKYNNQTLSLFLFIIILPLNIPGILFYIIIRPEDHSDIFGEKSDHNHASLNIPIVNFVNSNQDILMGLELKINGGILQDKFKNDLNLDINLNSNSENLEIIHRDIVVSDDEAEEDEEESRASFVSTISASIGSFFANLNLKKSKENEDEEDESEDSVDENSSDEVEEELEIGVNSSSTSSVVGNNSNNSKKSSKKKKNKKKSKK